MRCCPEAPFPRYWECVAWAGGGRVRVTLRCFAPDERKAGTVAMVVAAFVYKHFLEEKD